MGSSGPNGQRRRRLLAAMQGRALDDAYLHRAIREDLEADALNADPDGLLSAEVLEHVAALLAARAEASRGPVEPPDGPELFFGSDVVVIVPGLMASTLGDLARGGAGLIWVGGPEACPSLLERLRLGPYDGSEADASPEARIAAVGAVPIAYDVLRLALEVRRYTTEVFPVDWRKDLDLAASGLASRLRRLAAGASRAIHLVAHCQGALVARRAVQKLGPEEARRIIRHLVLLGPANFGTFAAAFSLAGRVEKVRWVRRLAIEPTAGFRDALGSMTGLYQLLPWDAERLPWLSDPSHDVSGRGFWKSGALDEARLDRFFGWGRDLDARVLDNRTALILGDNHGAPTAGGVLYHGPTLRHDGSRALAGDGTVPHVCAVLPGVPTYLAPKTLHSTLATDRAVIEAVADLLADRPVRLPALSSDPADHLKPPVPAPLVLPLRTAPLQDAVPRPEMRPGPGAPPDLNGTFLPPYGDVEAEPVEGADAACLHRHDQLAHQEPYLVFHVCTTPVSPDDDPVRPQPSASPSEPSRTDLAGMSQPTSRRTGPQAHGPSPELILDASNLLPFDFLRTGDRIGRAVVKIQRDDGAAGTGFLVAPNILLTNHHVLPDVATAASAHALANFERSLAHDPAGRPAVVPLEPQSLFLTNAELDFTFCAVEGLDFLGTVPLNRNSLNLITSEYVNIIQHPRGRPKEIALQDNQVIKADNVVVHYSCDTEPGSSGSPVFNNQWKLVAMHHASVTTDSPEGRRALDADPRARYLNEGIRLSAIAIWLETHEADTPEQEEHLQRLRSIFCGLDPQVGFFGALGRKVRGRTAAEVVVESYRGSADDLDIAFWNLRGLGRLFREHLIDLARVVAEMRIDLWCLTHLEAAHARALCDYLETNFQLDYDVLFEAPRGGPSVAVMYRRCQTLSVARVERRADDPEGLPVPLRLRLRTRTRRDGVCELNVVPMALGPPTVAETAAGAGPSALPMIDEVARAWGRGGFETDWLLIGDLESVTIVPAIHALGTGDPASLAVGASAERDGTALLLIGRRSRVERVFASPNLTPLFDASWNLTPTADRQLPAGIEALGGHRPIALRLVLGEPRTASPPPIPGVAGSIPSGPPSSVPAPPITPEALAGLSDEQWHALLRPIVARLVAETQGRSENDRT